MTVEELKVRPEYVTLAPQQNAGRDKADHGFSRRGSNMTIEDLKVDPRFITLAPSRREFVLAYCTNGADKIAAAKASGDITTEASAISKANTVLRDPQVRALVNVFYDRTEETGSKTEALAIVWKQIQKGGEDLLDYLKLYGDWMGFKSEKTPPENPSEPDLYDQVRELEKQEKK